MEIRKAKIGIYKISLQLNDLLFSTFDYDLRPLE